MKKFLIVILIVYSSLANSLCLTARNWYNRNLYALNLYALNNLRNLMAEYAFCRVQEIEAWLKKERKDLTLIDSEIANENLQVVLKTKTELETKIKRFYNGHSLLHSLRAEGNKIAQDKFTSEILNSLFIHYKVGKRAAAKTSKRDFYFECYKLLKYKASYR